jgi:hypothetical protein
MDIKAFPAATSIAVFVCNALYDATGIFVQDTDKPDVERWVMEMYAFRSNIQLTDNTNAYDGPLSDINTTEATGRVQYNVYFPTDRWKNPTTGVIELIPDYVATAWTSAGAAFFDVTIGATKVTRYPNHGQEMYASSSGRLGWDYINGVAGTNQGNELFGLIDTVRAYMFSNLGRYPSAFSYRNGQKGCSKMMLPYFLGGRNSELIQADTATNGKTDYGRSKDTGLAYLGIPSQSTTRELRISSESTSRFKDMVDATVAGTWGTEAQILTYLQGQMTTTIANKGFYNDFIHRYQYSTASQRAHFGTFIASQRTAMGSNFVWCTSYANAIEYLFYREMISRVTAFEHNNMVRVVIEKTDPYKSNLNSGISERIKYDLLRVSISIRIDLTGTYLAGKSIAANYGTILSKGSNVYVIQIPYGNAQEGFGAVELSETVSPAYISLALPVITSSSKVGNVVTVVTDQPTKAALFKATTGANENTSILHARDNVQQTTHTFDITGATGNDFRCGVITTTKQSILSGIIT